MERRRNTKADPEQYFIVVKNSYTTASLIAGQAVSYDYTVAKDGVSVTKPGVICGGASFAGIVAETIATGAYGLIQVFGYNSAVRVRATTGAAKAIVAGLPLTLDDYASFTLVPAVTSSTSNKKFMCGFALEGYSTRASASKKVFIKAL